MKRKRYLPIDNIDVRELLDELNIDYSERGKNVSEGWIGVTCPFCDDTSNHMGINAEIKTISCFKCGKTGNIINYLAEELNSFSKAISIIEESIPRELRNYGIIEKDRETVEKVLLPKGAIRGLLPEHAAYMKSRGFAPKKMAQMFHLHSCDAFAEPKWANRIIVPIIKNFRLVTYTSIDIHKDSDNRYIHLDDDLSIIPIKKLLYMSELTNGYSVIVVEGLFDAWRFMGGAVPMWGVKFTSEQVALLIKYRRVKIVGDGDKDGYGFNRKLSRTLAPYTDTSYFDLDEGVDPDNLTKEEIKHLKTLR